MSREAIYSALFSLIANDTRITSQFKTTGRLLKHFDSVPAEMCPALFMLQIGEDWQRPGKGVPPKRSLDCKIIIYTVVGNASETNLQSSVVNAALDVIDDVLTLQSNPGNVVNLGGLVEHVYIDGRVIIDEGLLQGTSVSVVPIKILIP